MRGFVVATLAALAVAWCCGCGKREKRTPPPPPACWSAPSDASARGCNALASCLALPPASDLADAPCDPAACERAGGRCAYGGLGCFHACLKRTRDAGQKCSDGSECEGRLCEAPSSTAVGKATSGACVDVVVAKGCRTSVRDGRVWGTICGD